MPTPRKKTILIPLDTYLPGFLAGGPIRSVANLVEALNGEFEFRVITLDRDLGDVEPYPSIQRGEWVTTGGAEVMYLPPGWQGIRRAFTAYRSLDENAVLYLNSTFGRRSSILPMLMRYFGLAKPQCVVLAPRGGFSPGALGLNPLRKRAYLRILGWMGFFDDMIWHACNELEKTNILACFPESVSVDLAANGSELSTSGRGRRGAVVVTAPEIASTKARLQKRPPKIAGRLRLVFVSRISPMKNLVGALQMLKGISGDISFDIYGPAEDAAYWAECQRAIDTLPKNIQVKYFGSLEPHQVTKVFSKYELFFFPTLGEGYGHVIYESLAAGCPVLISDQTPWRKLESEGAGWDLPLNAPDRFKLALQSLVDLDEPAYAAYSENTAEYLSRRTADPKTIDLSRQLFNLAFSWTRKAPAGPRSLRSMDRNSAGI